MTMYFNNEEFTILDAALTTRRERVLEMIKMFEDRNETSFANAYRRELNGVEQMQAKLNYIFNTEF